MNSRFARLLSIAGLLGIAAMPGSLSAANTYIQHNILSDISGMADKTDPGLVNPWGIATSATSPFWFSDAGSGLSTLYSTAGSGSIPATRVTITPAANASKALPTGIVFHTGAGFEVTTGHPASFIFDGEDGTITAWASAANPTQALVMVDNSAKNAVYTGLAIGTNAGNTYLYAANFYAGTVEVYDSTFKPVTLMTGAFTDPMIPSGYAPYNIQALGGNLYVAYAKQDPTKKFSVAGAGTGYVDVFDTAGNLKTHLISGATQLSAPWGLAIAPAGFGDYANDLLVGNFGDGLINVFNPSTGAYIATLKDPNGNNIVNLGLWALQAGNGGNGGDANAIYFTAGIPGPSGTIQSHGLFGSIQAAPALVTNGVVNGASFQPGIAPGTFITIAGSNLSSTTRTWQSSDFVNGALPTSLDGVSVMVDGQPAYPYYISPTQLDVLTPADMTTGMVKVVITNHGLTSGTSMVQLQSVAPGLFLFSGGKYVAATHANGTYVGATTLFPNLSTPAAAGETVVLYATGLGATNPITPGNMIQTQPNPLATLPTVMIGGTQATVVYAGQISPGLYQINVTIPSSATTGDEQVLVTAGGQTSPSALITIQ